MKELELKEREFEPKDIFSVAYDGDEGDLIINVVDHPNRSYSEENGLRLTEYHLPLYNKDSAMDGIESVLHKNVSKYGIHRDLEIDHDTDSPKQVGSINIEFSDDCIVGEYTDNINKTISKTTFNITLDQLSIIHDTIYTEDEFNM